MREKLKRDENDMTDDMVKIIKLVPLGLTKDEIGKREGINENSVKDAIRAMYDLYDVHTLQELTRVAIQLGYFVERRNWRAK